MINTKPDCLHEPNSHCIHSSERKSFRSCRRRWHWAYQEHYAPSVSPKPLEFGIAFHNAMEVIYDPKAWDKTSDEQKLLAGISIFEETCELQRDRFLEVTRQRSLDKPMGDDYAQRVELGIGMLTYYVHKVHPEADKFYKPVAVEIPFSVPLIYPEDIKLPDGAEVGEQLTCSSAPYCGQEHDNPAPVTLNGRVDAIFEDLVNGGYLLIDWKTAASLINDGEFLQFDDQITSYIAAIQLVLNIDVRGFLYSEIRKDYPKPPQELSRLYHGRKLSTNRQQMTTYEMALETIKDKDLGAYEAGFYNDYLTELKTNPPKFHQRFPVLQSEEKMRNVLKNVAMEAIEMTNPNTYLFPSPNKMNCQGCAYKAPCLAKFNSEQYQYTLDSLFGKKGRE